MTTEFTVASFADALNLSQPTIWRYITSGEIRAYKLGRSVRIPYQELERIRSANRIGGAE